MRATTGLMRAKTTCLSIPSGLGTTLEKNLFFALWVMLDPPLAPTMWGPGCPLAPPSDHWYAGVGVSLGHFEGWNHLLFSNPFLLQCQIGGHINLL